MHEVGNESGSHTGRNVTGTFAQGAVRIVGPANGASVDEVVQSHLGVPIVCLHGCGAPFKACAQRQLLRWLRAKSERIGTVIG